MAVPRERIDSRREVVIGPRRHGPAYQAYQVLLVGFTVAPIVAGVDKFFHFLVNWDQYLHPAIPQITGIGAHTFMLGVGVVEVAAGLIVAIKPRIGGWLVAAWLWGIVVNLLAIPGYLDIALRDFGLSLGALALARLASHFEHAREP
jgi:hypothetical protein